MFIVVAIVIFGIFVSLSYTLFGKEGLTDDLKFLFKSSTEQALDTVSSSKRNNLIKEKDLLQHGGLKEENFTTDNKGKITLTSEGTNYIGVRFPSTVMKDESEYSLSFNIKKIEGVVTTIGGHMSYSDKTLVYIDGILVSETNFQTHTYFSGWYYGVKINNLDAEHKVEVYYNTNLRNKKGTSGVYDTPEYQSLYIQPNRGDFGEAYKVEITNLELHDQ